MTRHFDIPMFYRNTGRAPRKKADSTFNVRADVTIAFEEVDADQVSPAVTFIYTDDYGTVHETVIRQFEGRLIGEAAATTNAKFIDGTVTLGTLSGCAGLHPMRIPKILCRKSEPRLYSYSHEWFDRDALRPERITADGYGEAAVDLQKQVSEEIVLVDGVAWEPAREPRWNVSHLSGQIWMEATLTASGDFSFPADCRDEALAFGQWWADHTGLPLNVFENATIRIDDGDYPREAGALLEAAASLGVSSIFKGQPDSHTAEGARTMIQTFLEESSLDGALAYVEHVKALVDAMPDRFFGFVPGRIEAFWKFLEMIPDRYRADMDSPIEIYGVTLPGVATGFAS